MKSGLLLDLRRQVLAVFTQKGYKDSCIKRYNNSWNNLQEYMEIHGYEMFSSEVGKSFLDERHGGRLYKNLSDREKEVVRHITVLADIIESGIVRRSVIDNKVITFPGKTGEPFIRFINEQSPLKRASSIQHYKERIYNLYQYLIKERILPYDMDMPCIIT